MRSQKQNPPVDIFQILLKMFVQFLNSKIDLLFL